MSRIDKERIGDYQIFVFNADEFFCSVFQDVIEKRSLQRLSGEDVSDVEQD